MKTKRVLCALSLAVLLTAMTVPMWAASVTVTVLGNMDPYLAGMPDGSTASGGWDVAPNESPLLALTGFQPGSVLTFSTTSTCGFSYFGGCGPSSADGDSSGGPSDYAPENGLSQVLAPWNSLLGVFLDASQPSLTLPPGTLDFLSGIGTSFATLSPDLKQVFFIGDGLTGLGTGSVQQFTAPAGATRLFLASKDGYGWYNNGGYQDVTINYTGSGGVPEPASMFLLGGGLLGLAFVRSRKR